jgi:hypothetical protein
MVNRRTHSTPRRGLPERKRPPAGYLAVRRSDHPCEEFLDRRPCFAVAQMPRGQVRRARLHRETHLLAADRRALHRPGLLMPCRCFRNALLCSKAARQSATTTEAARRCCDGRIGPRRSVARCGQGDANATTRNDRESTMLLASNAADRTSGVSDGAARRVPGPCRNSRSEGGLWNRPYTLWRADRPLICGRNAVAH